MSRLSALSVDGEHPNFDTAGLRDTSTISRSGKSHTAFGLRHVDIGLRTVFLLVTFSITQSTLGSRHEALFQRISFTFHGTLATTLAFASLVFATFSFVFPLLLPLWVLPLLSLPLSRNDSSLFRTTNVAERPSGAGIAITGQKPRPRLT